MRFQLDIIEAGGGKEVIIVTPREYRQQMDSYISSLTELDLKIDLVYMDRMVNSADGLRSVSDRITGDFIIMSTNFIAVNVSLGTLTELHRVKAADLTLMLSTDSTKDMDKRFYHEKTHYVKHEEDKETIMLATDGRVVAKFPVFQANQMIHIGKSFLDSYTSNVTIRNDVLDVGKSFFMLIPMLRAPEETKNISYVLCVKIQEFMFVRGGSLTS